MAQAGAYYNEIDPYAADWLRNLIAAGHIAPGDVDERSIEDVHPDDLRPYTQCHFFAGIGVWSYALRRAGWPDDRPVWTGSCPCQPFSAAGKGTAFDDERHLWPAWHWLISECRPPVVFGEQVASKDAEPWLDLVQTDMEALAFAIAAVAFPSASVGAPHIRDRTYFVAHAGGTRLEGSAPGTVGRQRAAAERSGRAGRMAHSHVITGGQGRSINGGRHQGSDARARPGSGGDGVPFGLADAQQHHRGCQAAPANHDRPQADGPTDRAGGRGGSSGELGNASGERCGEAGRAGAGPQERIADAGADGRLADTHGGKCEQQPSFGGRTGVLGTTHDATWQFDRPSDSGPSDSVRTGPVNGFWRDADWLLCRDGKWRPVEPGTFPLAHGAPARVGRLRAYGNAINAQQAQIFIEESMRCI